MKRTSRQHTREPAQVIALFAIALLAMLAMVGVVVDGGTLYLQRRTAQNAADAGALAGARVLQQAVFQYADSPASLDVGTAICYYAHQNWFGHVPETTANFVTTSGPVTINVPTSCAAPTGGTPQLIPSGTSGVRVHVLIGPYDTFLVGIVGLRQLQAEASASAQVGVLGIPGPAITPLAGCGPDMLTSGTLPIPFVDLLDDSNNIDETLYDHFPAIDVVLQGSQMTQNETSQCPKWNNNSSAWKGQIDTSGISGTFAPGPDSQIPVPVAVGNSTIDAIISSMCLSLYGPGHDPTGVSGPPDPNVCRLLVPIAAPPNPTDKANIVTLACFSLYDGGTGTQKWRGVLHREAECDYGLNVPTWSYGNTNKQTQVFLTE